MDLFDGQGTGGGGVEVEEGTSRHDSWSTVPYTFSRTSGFLVPTHIVLPPPLSLGGRQDGGRHPEGATVTRPVLSPT